MFNLTKSEKQLMEVLWNADAPLTSAEIVNRSEDKTWKDSYIHIMLRSLLKKELIKVDGVELVCKNYARKFAPTMTKDEYIIKTLIGEEVWSRDQVPPLVVSFVKNEADLEMLERISEIISERKREIKSEGK